MNPFHEKLDLSTLFLLLLVTPVILFAGFTVFPSAGAFIITSGSMSPAISEGSVVYVADTDTYAPGDVVTFRQSGMRVTHRIVEETDNGFRTKGDNNDSPDSKLVPKEQVIGEVLFSLPFYGHVFSFAQSPLGFFLFLFIPGLLLVGLELRQIWDQ